MGMNPWREAREAREAVARYEVDLAAACAERDFLRREVQRLEQDFIRVSEREQVETERNRELQKLLVESTRQSSPEEQAQNFARWAAQMGAEEREGAPVLVHEASRLFDEIHGSGLNPDNPEHRDRITWFPAANDAPHEGNS